MCWVPTEQADPSSSTDCQVSILPHQKISLSPLIFPFKYRVLEMCPPLDSGNIMTLSGRWPLSTWHVAFRTQAILLNSTVTPPPMA